MQENKSTASGGHFMRLQGKPYWNSGVACYLFLWRQRNGQLVLALNSEMMIPENAPVRLLNAQLEELEYGKLYEAYSSKGRKSAADPRMLFKVLVHGYLCGIYSSRKLEEACQYRIDFKWLLEDGKAPDHSTFARFRTGRCREAVEDLFYQFVRKLEEVGETDHKTVFIDGTKLESRAGRYSFVWRKNVEKQLARVKEKLKSMTGLSTCAAVRSMLEEEPVRLRLSAERVGIKDRLSGNGRRKRCFWSGGKGTKICFPSWARGVTAMPRPTQTPPSCE